MPKLTPIASSLACALAITGCAGTLQSASDQTSTVQPVFGIKHSVSASALYRLGRFYEAQARHEQAIFAYREALKREPDHVAAHSGLGVSLAASGRHDEAIAQFQAAIAISPDRAYLHNNLGYALLLQGSDEQAVKALEEAHRLDPHPERAANYNLRLAHDRIAAAEKARQAAAGDTSSTRSVAPAENTPEPQLASAPRATIELVEVKPSVYELRGPVILSKLTLPPIQATPLPARVATPSLKPFRLEVSNGNGVTGLAKRVAGRLAAAGLDPAARLTNQLPFQQRETEIQYREGYAGEAAALAGKLQGRVQVLPSKQLAGHIHVRLVLGKDVGSASALMIPDTPRPTIAAKLP